MARPQALCLIRCELNRGPVADKSGLPMVNSAASPCSKSPVSGPVLWGPSSDTGKKLPVLCRRSHQSTLTAGQLSSSGTKECGKQYSATTDTSTSSNGKAFGFRVGQRGGFRNLSPGIGSTGRSSTGLACSEATQWDVRCHQFSGRTVGPYTNGWSSGSGGGMGCKAYTRG